MVLFGAPNCVDDKRVNIVKKLSNITSSDVMFESRQIYQVP